MKASDIFFRLMEAAQERGIEQCQFRKGQITHFLVYPVGKPPILREVVLGQGVVKE